MKKVLVCGKGGTGKSFFIFLLAKVLLNKGKRVIVVDTDESNQSLHKFFGFNEPPLDFMEFLGGKVALKEKMFRRFRSEEKEHKLSILEKETYFLEEIPEEFLKKKEDLYLISIGKIKEPLEGCACPMGVLSREFLEKIILREEEIILVDTEAGLEHFGRGIEKGVDTVIALAEPYLDSIEVAEKAISLAQKMGKRVYFVLNKVPWEYEEKIKEILSKKGLLVTGILHFYPEIYEASLEGKVLLEGKIFEEINNLLPFME